MADPKDIAKVLRKLQYGVYVVTMGKGNEGNAFTASWISQVSSLPPMLALAVNNKHQSARLLNELDAYAVNLIPEGQDAVAKAYYGPAESGYEKLKAKNVAVSSGTGTALLAGVMGYLDCRIVNRVGCGNHTLYIGEIVAAHLDADGRILTTEKSGMLYLG